MVAWEAYKATEEYANTKQWAAYPEHVDGSLWAAFDRGYAAALRELAAAQAVARHESDCLDAAKARIRELEQQAAHVRREALVEAERVLDAAAQAAQERGDNKASVLDQWPPNGPWRRN